MKSFTEKMKADLSKKMMRNRPYYRSYGFLSVFETESGTHIAVQYCGNMGARESSAQECFDNIYGKGSWEKFKQLKFFVTKNSSFDYLWTAVGRKSEFLKLFA